MISKSSIAAAKKAGGTVKKKRARKVVDTKQTPTGNQSAPAKDHEPELKRLRAEISELRRLLEEARNSASRRDNELAATLSSIVAAMNEQKPFRIKPIRNMDAKSPDYLLVEHYDFVPVSYRKLDS